MVKAPRSSHITPILGSPPWLNINDCIEYKVFTLTYKVLTTSQPDYLYTILSLFSLHVEPASHLPSVTLARPSASFSLQVTNRSFRYASPYLWNQLPSPFRQPHSVHSSPGSRHPAHVASSQSPPSLSPSITPSAFHSRLKTHLLHERILHVDSRLNRVSSRFAETRFAEKIVLRIFNYIFSPNFLLL